MPNSYWELYIAYLDKCKNSNWLNDLDPHHYEMEWNHTLPRSIFGDQPIGQWLTKRQHAIASALQTLVFERACLCTWHEDHLPGALFDLARPFVLKQRGENGKKIKKESKGIFNPKHIGSGARATVLKEVGLHDPEYKYSEKAQKDRSKAGQRGSSVTNSQIWISLVDGYQNNAGAVACHNIKNGWNPNDREKLS